MSLYADCTAELETSTKDKLHRLSFFRHVYKNRNQNFSLFITLLRCNAPQAKENLWREKK